MMPGGSTTEPEVATAQEPDPMFPDNPDEDLANDTRFTIRLVVSVRETPAQP
jgi:hypothetical protein